MTDPRVKALMICSHVELGPPLVLHGLRRHWRQPPESLWLVADIENPTEQSFSWQITLARRRLIVDSSVETLELGSPRQFYAPVQLSVSEAKPVVYVVRWLLNGRTASMIEVDFGFPEAAP